MSQQQDRSAQNGQSRRQGQNQPRPSATANSGNNRAIANLESHPLLMANDQWQRLESLAQRFYKSGCAPKCLNNAEAVLIVMLKGLEMGLTPMYAAENIAVINGKATVGGQAILRLIYERCPGVKVTFHTPTEKQSTECDISIQRPGQEAVRLIFTLEDAKRAGLMNKPGPWQQYPRMMLRWRAVAECGRIAVPDAIAGVYLHEEMGANVNEQGEIIDADFVRADARRIAPEPDPVIEAVEAEERGELTTPAAATLKPERAPLPNDGVYRIPFGNKHYGVTLQSIAPEELTKYAGEVATFYANKQQPFPPEVEDFLKRVELELGPK